MPDVQEGRFEHTLEEIDSATSQVFNAKGDFPNLEAALAAKQDDLDFDEKPVENSTNPILSGGVYPLLEALQTIVDEDYKENVLSPLTEGSTVGSEVQFAVNSDGSVTATCTATTTAARAVNWYATIPAGTWHFSTNQPQSGASPAPCYAYLYTNATIARDYGDDKNFTLNAATQVRCYLQIRSGVASGTTFTFYPMVCAQKWAAISDKYVPYSET